MSAITVKVVAAIAGALLGLGAFWLACNALTHALTGWLGTIGGLAAASALLAAFAFLAFWILFRRSEEVATETEEAKTAAADMLAGLPGEAVMSIIRKHPVTAILAAVMIGYSLIRDPGRVMRQLQSIVIGLLK